MSGGEIVSIPAKYDDVGVDTSGFDHALILRIHNFDSDEPETTEYRIAVQDVPAFMQAVANSAATVLERAARQMSVGHCETCHNRRLVETVKHGRPWNEACPDCTSKPGPHGFAAAPKIGDRMHRQVHRPDTGDSVCTCGEWEGPMSTLPDSDARSFAAHVGAR